MIFIIKSFLKNNYNLDVYDIRQMAIGTGGYSYKIITKSNVYVLKLTKEDSMNHPLIELIICEVLNNLNYRFGSVFVYDN